MNTVLTQKDRILNRLNAGPFCAMEALDWEPRVYRVAARIKDLRDDGHEIITQVCAMHYGNGSAHAAYRLLTQEQMELFG